MTGGGRKGAAEFIIPGTVKALYENDKTHPGVNSPWFQVHSIRKLVSTGTTQQNGQTVAGVDRFRVLLSDGDFTIPGKESFLTSKVNQIDIK